MTEPRNANESEPRRTYGFGDEETPSEAVITAVAESTDQSPLEMDRLIEAVDPDALNSVLDDGPARDGAPVAVSFDYCGCHVTATPGEIRIDESSEGYTN